MPQPTISISSKCNWVQQREIRQQSEEGILICWAMSGPTALNLLWFCVVVQMLLKAGSVIRFWESWLRCCTLPGYLKVEYLRNTINDLEKVMELSAALWLPESGIATFLQPWSFSMWEWKKLWSPRWTSFREEVKQENSWGSYKEFCNSLILFCGSMAKNFLQNTLCPLWRFLCS